MVWRPTPDPPCAATPAAATTQWLGGGDGIGRAWSVTAPSASWDRRAGGDKGGRRRPRLVPRRRHRLSASSLRLLRYFGGTGWSGVIVLLWFWLVQLCDRGPECVLRRCLICFRASVSPVVVPERASSSIDVVSATPLLRGAASAPADAPLLRLAAGLCTTCRRRGDGGKAWPGSSCRERPRWPLRLRGGGWPRCGSTPRPGTGGRGRRCSSLWRRRSPVTAPVAAGDGAGAVR